MKTECGHHQNDNDDVRSITDSFQRTSVLGRGPGSLEEFRRRNQAENMTRQLEAIARSITDPDRRATALADIAGILAETAGDRRAGDIARATTARDSQARALERVAEALAGTGHHQLAKAIARSITGEDWEAPVLAQIALALAQAGEPRPASRLAATAVATGEWTSAVEPIALLAPSAFPTLSRMLG
jgi:hypothetical protein